MGMSIDDMYDWLYRLKSELVVYMPKEWHEPMRCSIQDAITFSRKYQMLKADYELLSASITMMQADYNARLKADMVAMLTELQLELEELPDARFYKNNEYGDVIGYIEYPAISKDALLLIQQKITELKGEQNT